MADDAPLARDANGAPDLPLTAARAGKEAKSAGEPREAPPVWANSPYTAFWYAGYDL